MSTEPAKKLHYQEAAQLIKELGDDNRKHLLQQIKALYAEKGLEFRFSEDYPGNNDLPPYASLTKPGEKALFLMLHCEDTTGMSPHAAPEKVMEKILGHVKRYLQKLGAQPLTLMLTPGKAMNKAAGVGARTDSTMLRQQVLDGFGDIDRFPRVRIELTPEQSVEMTEAEFREAITSFMAAKGRGATPLERILKEGPRSEERRP